MEFNFQISSAIGCERFKHILSLKRSEMGNTSLSLSLSFSAKKKNTKTHTHIAHQSEINRNRVEGKGIYVYASSRRASESMQSAADCEWVSGWNEKKWCRDETTSAVDDDDKINEIRNWQYSVRYARRVKIISSLFAEATTRGRVERIEILSQFFH